MAGALIGNIKRLARLAEYTPKAQDRECLVLSAFLNAGAALEATLHEYAYKTNFPLYSGVDPSLKKSHKGFRWKGIEDKYELLRQYPNEPGDPPTLLASDFPDVVKVLNARHALTHNEQDSKRSRFVGEVNNIEGAHWAHRTGTGVCQGAVGRLPSRRNTGRCRGKCGLIRYQADASVRVQPE
jgi:hypothetical protein